MLQEQQRRPAFARAAISALALTLFVFIQALAASHQFHEALHSDAAAPQHHCAATILSHGLLEAANTQVACAPVIRHRNDAPEHPVVQLTSSSLENLPPVRGPPLPPFFS